MMSGQDATDKLAPEAAAFMLLLIEDEVTPLALPVFVATAASCAASGLTSGMFAAKVVLLSVGAGESLSDESSDEVLIKSSPFTEALDKTGASVVKAGTALLAARSLMSDAKGDSSLVVVKVLVEFTLVEFWCP